VKQKLTILISDVKAGTHMYTPYKLPQCQTAYDLNPIQEQCVMTLQWAVYYCE